MSTISLSRNKRSRMLANLTIIYSYVIIAFLMSCFLTNENIRTSLFYCAVVLSAVMFASFADLLQRNRLFYNLFMFLSFFVLFFTYGFRDFSAIDDTSYIRIFTEICANGWFEYFKFSTMEPGYLFLNYIVSLFTDNYLYMQLLTSFIPLALFYYGFHKYRKIISLPTAVFLLCTMLYFQMLAVGLVRMFIAISIAFVAFRFIPKQKTIKFVLYILIATLFHYSALFLVFLAYFSIHKKNLKNKTARFYALFFFISPFLFIFIGRTIVPLLGGRYSSYELIGSIDLNMSTVTTLPLIILLLLYQNKFNENEQVYFKLFVFIYSLSIIISLFGDLIGLGRLIFYSYAAFILGASMVNHKGRFKSSKAVFATIIIVYAFSYVFYSQFTNELHIPNLYPYVNIFLKI